MKQSSYAFLFFGIVSLACLAPLSCSPAHVVSASAINYGAAKKLPDIGSHLTTTATRSTEPHGHTLYVAYGSATVSCDQRYIVLQKAGIESVLAKEAGSSTRLDASSFLSPDGYTVFLLDKEDLPVAKSYFSILPFDPATH